MAGVAFKVIGAIGLASYTVAWLCTKLRRIDYHRFKLVAVHRGHLPRIPRGYHWRMLTAAELAGHPIDIGPEAQQARWQAGLQCLAVFDRQGEFAGCSWLGRHRAEEPHFGVGFDLPGGAAWDTGLWVPQDRRMTRAFSAIWAAIGEWLDSEGLDWTVSTIADYNVASILAHRRLGAVDLRNVVAVRLGHWRLTLGAWPLVQLARSPDFPRLRITIPPRAVAPA